MRDVEPQVPQRILKELLRQKILIKHYASSLKKRVRRIRGVREEKLKECGWLQQRNLRRLRCY